MVLKTWNAQHVHLEFSSSDPDLPGESVHSWPDIVLSYESKVCRKCSVGSSRHEVQERLCHHTGWCAVPEHKTLQLSLWRFPGEHPMVCNWHIDQLPPWPKLSLIFCSESNRQYQHWTLCSNTTKLSKFHPASFIRCAEKLFLICATSAPHHTSNEEQRRPPKATTLFQNATPQHTLAHN